MIIQRELGSPSSSYVNGVCHRSLKERARKATSREECQLIRGLRASFAPVAKGRNLTPRDLEEPDRPSLELVRKSGYRRVDLIDASENQCRVFHPAPHRPERLQPQAFRALSSYSVTDSVTSA